MGSEIADRHWLAKQGMMDPELFLFLGGMSQDHWEYSIAHAVLKRFMRVPRSILEVGVYSGYTMMGWLTLPNWGQEYIAVGVDAAPQITAPLPNDVKLVTGDSHDPAVIQHVKSLFPAGVDYLFIDGDHGLVGCMQDYNNFAPLVNEGGAVGFHDILIGDVRATWREVVRRYPTVQVQNTAPDGSRMGIGLAFRLPHCGPFQPIQVDDV